MDAIKFRRTVSLVASAALITALTVGAYTAPVAAAPDEQHAVQKQARAEARAAAKAARAAQKQARVEGRAAAKAARTAQKQVRAEARAAAKEARLAQKQARAEARAAAKEAATEKVVVCHQPGTSAEGTLEISGSALPAHLGHGDVEGACELTTSTTLGEAEGSDGETSEDCTDEDDAACDQVQQLLVSIDAPESVESQDVLSLQGSVSGLEADDLSYEWSSTCLTDEELNDPSIIASEPDTAVLVIREDTLPPGTTCDFTLAVSDETAGAAGSATVTIEVVALA